LGIDGIFDNNEPKQRTISRIIPEEFLKIYKDACFDILDKYFEEKCWSIDFIT